MARLLYATPTARHPKPEYVCSMRAMELGCRTFERRAEDFQFSDGPVQMARSRIAQRALEGVCGERHDHGDRSKCVLTPYDYVVMHDDDLLVAPQGRYGNPLDVWHELMEKTPDVGFIGAVYLREFPPVPNVVIPHRDHPEELCHVVAGLPANPVEVAGVGTGFFMVRVSALRAIADMEDADGGPPMFRFETPQTKWGVCQELGEDYGFCLRMRKAGFKVLADARFPTIHCKDSSRLRYEQVEWEQSWNIEGPQFIESAKKVRSFCAPTIKLTTQDGYLVLDHIAQRELDAKAWRERQAKRAEKAA